MSAEANLAGVIATLKEPGGAEKASVAVGGGQRAR